MHFPEFLYGIPASPFRPYWDFEFLELNIRLQICVSQPCLQVRITILEPFYKRHIKTQAGLFCKNFQK